MTANELNGAQPMVYVVVVPKLTGDRNTELPGSPLQEGASLIRSNS